MENEDSFLHFWKNYLCKTWTRVKNPCVIKNVFEIFYWHFWNFVCETLTSQIWKQATCLGRNVLKNCLCHCEKMFVFASSVIVVNHFTKNFQQNFFPVKQFLEQWNIQSSLTDKGSSRYRDYLRFFLSDIWEIFLNFLKLFFWKEKFTFVIFKEKIFKRLLIALKILFYCNLSEIYNMHKYKIQYINKNTQYSNLN